ncbi:MAG: DNA methyltransferase [Cyanobacteria bacterium MAG CAR2_bin_4]|nr:DNA methyltransferase [Cyanobacteria bacterium MAG CAR2_bin_4]
MNSESVDLIATDPPFNKSRDFHATPDSLSAGAKFQDRWTWERDVHEDWVDQIADDFPKVMQVIESARCAHSDGMGAFLCFMAVRLLEMRRVLKSTGSIYLHCDPTASHYLKLIMDAIFGRRNFVNEIVWCYKPGGASPKKYFSRKHDLIFWYSKSKNYLYNRQEEKSYNRNHKPYRFKGAKEYENSEGRWYTIVDMKDYWEIDMVGRTSSERTGYPTQKPLTLYERIVNATSNEGDVILDPFAGCATTLIAAERLNRKWVGIDIWDNAINAVQERLSQEKFMAVESADERLALYPVHYKKDLPLRTDNGEEAAPFLRVRERVKEPEGPKWTRAQMYEHLLTQQGNKCQGCDRTFDDPRYLELDHNIPRSDGGINHITNRILLCGPCNKLKSNIYTLSGLRRENKKRGHLRI